jgi:1,4-dihydroxy-2-naphthoate octaprenyltransferase
VPGPAHSLSAGLWRLADPKISLASFASLFLGAALAARDGDLSIGWLAVTVAGIFALEIAKNASGEVHDFAADRAVKDDERTPFSGGKRVLVDGVLTRKETAAIAAIGYGIAAACGMAIVLWREPAVLALGILGVACAYFYNAPPLRLSYRGLGEIVVGVCYGPLIACGTFLVQRGTITPTVAILSIPLGLLITAFLWVNEIPDRRADESAGKRTLVVRLGIRRATSVFGGILAAAFALLVAVPLAGLPLGLALGVIAAAPALLAVRDLKRSVRDSRTVAATQRLTLVTFLLFAIGSGAGALFS